MKKVFFSLMPSARFSFLNFSVSLSILAVFFSLDILSAQSTGLDCTPFKLEFCKTVPTTPWPANSTFSTPGAFQCYFDVKLKTKNMSNLPSSWQLNWLAFMGKLTVNGFTSRINQTLTNDYTNALNSTTSIAVMGQNPYAQYLSFVPETGEVTWIINPDNPTCEAGNVKTLYFPQNVSEVTLFTIVVDAVEGDVISWQNRSIDLLDCFANPPCNAGSTMAFSDCTAGTAVTFPANPVCQPSFPPKSISYLLSSDPGVGLILETKLYNLTAGNTIEKLDGVIHIVPQITPPDYVELEQSSLIDSPKLQTKVRKNADGSSDVYFWLPDGIPWTPSFIDPVGNTILKLKVKGYFNPCLGFKLICTTPANRIVEAGANTCKLVHLTSSNTSIPGNPVCGNGIKVTSSTIIEPNCVSVKSTSIFTHNASTALSYSYFKFQIGFIKGNSNLPIPVTLATSTSLPCPNCWTSSNGDALWTFEYNDSNPLLIANGVHADFELPVEFGCTRYYVICAEGTLSGNTSKCGIPVGYDLNHYPACDPNIKVNVATWNTHEIENYIVSLVSLNNPANNIPPQLGKCDDNRETSFCPNINDAPFNLNVNSANDNYLYGVNTLDLIPLSKHILGIQPFTSPYQYVAADANGNGQITTFDIVEIRKLILGIYDRFYYSYPIPVIPSFYYFKSDYILTTPPPTMPSLVAANINSTTVKIGETKEFTVVKVGDVNGSGYCGSQLKPNDPAETRNSGLLPSFVIEQTRIKREGNTLFVPIRASSPTPIYALQACFKFDPTQFSLIEVIPNRKNKQLSLADFGTTHAFESGEVRFAWIPEDGITSLPANDWLFTLHLELKNGNQAQLNEPFILLDNTILFAESYTQDEQSYPMQLYWRTGHEEAITLHIVAAPNPFRQAGSSVWVFTPISGSALLHVLDVNGRQQLEQRIQLEAGENRVLLEGADSLNSGVYILDLEQSGQHTQQRIVKN